MAPASPESGGTVVAFLDVGTYSLRMLLVRFNPNHSYTILSDRKEAVRLGSQEYGENRLQDDAIARGVLVCRNFVDMAGAFNAAEIIAVATSATREAENQRALLRRVRKEVGLDIRIVSGKEEARLVYLGVSRGTHLGGRSALFIDVGGGSTEVIVGDERDYRYLDSLKLGAIRIAQMFELDQPARPIAPALYSQVRRYIRSASIRTIQQLRSHPWELVIASSGTARNLAGVAAQNLRGSPPEAEPTLTRDELRKIARLLASVPLPQRKQIPGLNPERADIIVAGAAILETLMDELGIQQLQTSSRGLRDGLLVTYLARREHEAPIYALSARRRSVMLLGRLCGFDEKHSQHVAHLALELFDAAGALKLHPYGDAERELLEYAALLHDIGVFLSFVNHQAHTYYLIRNADLVGFDQTEIALMAAVARFHRKGAPRKKSPELAGLDRRNLKTVLRLAVMLRFAERLDRSHSGAVSGVRLRRVTGGQAATERSKAPPDAEKPVANARKVAAESGSVTAEREKSASDGEQIALVLVATGDCTLEQWAVERDRAAFRRAFGSDLVVERTDAPAAANAVAATAAAGPASSSPRA